LSAQLQAIGVHPGCLSKDLTMYAKHCSERQENAVKRELFVDGTGDAHGRGMAR
jgi:hypothetical protein